MAFRAATQADDAQMADLDRYLALLTDWNGRMNLMGPSGLADFWTRHTWDSAQLLRHAGEAKTFADLGAGAGFPGIVLAIMLKRTPGARIHLVESMTKRCRFLQVVVDELKLPAQVHNQRAEDGALEVEVVTARACAPMDRLLRYAQPWLKRSRTGLFLKGGGVEAELVEAASAWTFAYSLVPSLSGSGQIVRIEGAPVARR